MSGLEKISFANNEYKKAKRGIGPMFKNETITKEQAMQLAWLGRKAQQQFGLKVIKKPKK